MTFNHRPARYWLKIMISCRPDLVDAIAGYLGPLTGSGIEIIDRKSAADKPERATVIGYLLDNQERQDKEENIRAFVDGLQRKTPDPNFSVQTDLIKEEDWGTAWKQFFRPEKITSRLVIKPTWEEYQPAPGELVIEMDPGMAFGTGHHASTRLALNLIEKMFAPTVSVPQNVLDVGTGTGILGMACCLFGADKVLALDNDPDAVAAALENVAQNSLQGKMTASDQDVNTVNDSYDLIIANITHDILINLAPQLIRNLKNGGNLIIAGILQGEQEENIRNAYENFGLLLKQKQYMEEWVALTFFKKPSAN